MTKTYTKEHIKLLRRRFNCRINLKNSIFRRDNWTCKLCGETAEEIDHIKPIAQFPELVYEPSNLRALCKNCNRTRRKKWLVVL